MNISSTGSQVDIIQGYYPQKAFRIREDLYELKSIWLKPYTHISVYGLLTVSEHQENW